MKPFCFLAIFLLACCFFQCSKGLSPQEPNPEKATSLIISSHLISSSLFSSSANSPLSSKKVFQIDTLHEIKLQTDYSTDGQQTVYIDGASYLVQVKDGLILQIKDSEHKTLYSHMAEPLISSSPSSSNSEIESFLEAISAQTDLSKDGQQQVTFNGGIYTVTVLNGKITQISKNS